MAVPTLILVYYIDRETVSLTQWESLYLILYDPKITESLGMRLDSKALTRYIIRL